MAARTHDTYKIYILSILRILSCRTVSPAGGWTDPDGRPPRRAEGRGSGGVWNWTGAHSGIGGRGDISSSCNKKMHWHGHEYMFCIQKGTASGTGAVLRDGTGRDKLARSQIKPKQHCRVRWGPGFRLDPRSSVTPWDNQRCCIPPHRNVWGCSAVSPPAARHRPSHHVARNDARFRSGSPAVSQSDTIWSHYAKTIWSHYAKTIRRQRCATLAHQRVCVLQGRFNLVTVKVG